MEKITLTMTVDIKTAWGILGHLSTQENGASVVSQWQTVSNGHGSASPGRGPGTVTVTSAVDLDAKASEAPKAKRGRPAKEKSEPVKAKAPEQEFDLDFPETESVEDSGIENLAPEKEYSEEDVKAAFQGYAKRKEASEGREKMMALVKNILNKFDAPNLKSLKPEHYAAAIELVQ
jgi:hypothetical protein